MKLRRAPMAGLAVLASTAAQPSAAAASEGACSHVPGLPVTVEVSGLRPGVGWIRLELFGASGTASKRQLLTLAQEGRSLRRTWSPVPTTSAVQLCIAAPGADRFARLLSHARSGRTGFDPRVDGIAWSRVDVTSQGGAGVIRVRYS